MKIFDEKGVTLVELLATFSVALIVLPVIYGVFATGLNLYHKIQIEGQLRDDADYTVTMMMNTLYSEPFDYVKSCGENCIELVQDKKTASHKYEQNSQTFYKIGKEELSNPITTKISFIEKDGLTVAAINDSPLDVVADFSNSTISLSCDRTKEKCEGGIIKLQFILDDERLKNPLHLQSEFGF